MPRKTILFLTGTRADFGKLKPLIGEVLAATDQFECRIFATGMHMLARYGSTILEVKRLGVEHVFTFINQDGKQSAGMDLALANTIQGLGHYLREFPADLIVVHGDRIEALAGAVVGALHNTLVAHVEGGEVSGTIDELLRHAISKLSHLHFVANEEAGCRLIQMGETPDSIFKIGSPDIDVMLSPDLPDLAEVRVKYEIQFEHYGIFIYHTVTTELDTLEEKINQVTEAISNCDHNFVVIYPNNDAGSDVIMKAISRFHGSPRFRVLPSMRFEYFLSLLKNAKVIVGNSSAGIREAPVYGVPTVNIGSRQTRRFSSPSIANVPEDSSEIRRALHELPTNVEPCFHFGVGDSAKRFVRALHDPNLWNVSGQKQFLDLDWPSRVATGSVGRMPR